MMRDEEYYCERCGRKLDPDKVVWLSHRTSTGTYHDPSEGPILPPEDDQGAFPFGSLCAQRAIGESAEF